MSARDIYPDHGWRVEQHGSIRNGYHLQVSRAWCVPGDAATPWGFRVWTPDGDELPDDAGWNYGTLATASEAMRAAEDAADKHASASIAPDPYCFAWLPQAGAVSP